MKRYFKIAEAEEQGCPLKPAYLYKLHHYQEYPNLFVKFKGQLFVDRQVLDKLFDEGRQSNTLNGGRKKKP
ncbi:MAG: hypothetical protein ABSG91_06535 [Syntrophobacteraceae bacterium]